MAVVYQHRRNDTNDVFYIGIGKNKKRPIEVVEKLKKPKINKSNYSYPKNKIKCPYCEMEAQASLAYRWHFDNCKNKI